MTERTSARLIRWAPVLAAFVTTVSMIFAVTTYWRGSREHRQAAAIGILQDYLKFSVEHPELASRPADAPIDARYAWFATHTLFTVESLWTLVGDDERWDRRWRCCCVRIADICSRVSWVVKPSMPVFFST